MKIRNCILLVLLMPLGLFAQTNKAAKAERVFMPFFEIINMKWQYQYSTAKLLKGYAVESGRYDIILPKRVDTLYNIPSDEVIKKTAESINAPVEQSR